MREIEGLENRDVKGIWIPISIWRNKELSAIEVILLAEIDSLDKAQGCYASNEYFAKFLDISEASVSRYITHLKKLGLVYQKKFDGRTRYLGVRYGDETTQNCEGRIDENAKSDYAKMRRQTTQKCTGGLRKNAPHINIDDKREKRIDDDYSSSSKQSLPPRSVIRDSMRRVLNAYPESRRQNGLTMDAIAIFERDRLWEREAEVVKAIEAWKSSDDWTKDGGKWIPSFTKFLETEKWRFKPASAPQGEKTAFDTLFSPRLEGETEIEYLRRNGFDVTGAEECV